MPIVVLPARDGSGDNYATKPFGLDELLARLRAVRTPLRARDARRGVEAGGLLIDLAAATVTGQASGCTSPRAKWGMPQVLVAHRGMLATRQQLLQTVRGPAWGEEAQHPAGVHGPS